MNQRHRTLHLLVDSEANRVLVMRSHHHGDLALLAALNLAHDLEEDTLVHLRRRFVARVRRVCVPERRCSASLL